MKCPLWSLAASVEALPRSQARTKISNLLQLKEFEDAWDVGEPNKALIELRVKYQASQPFRNKSEQKVYSAKDPGFFRIYRFDSATQMLKSVPMNVNRIQEYTLRVTTPEMSSIFDGNEQVVAITAIPLYVRQVFLP